MVHIERDLLSFKQNIYNPKLTGTDCLIASYRELHLRETD